MQTIADISVDQFLCFLLAFVRIITVIVLMPIVGGGTNSPKMAIIGISAFLALILFPLIPVQTVEIPTGVFSFAVVAIKEMLIGMLIGYTGSLLFASLQFGGRMIDRQMGLAMARMFDPVTSTQSTLVAQFNVVLFTIIFFILGGHRIFIRALAYSFSEIPVGSVKVASGPVAKQIMVMTGRVLETGVKLAAPVLVALLITTAGLGIVARTVPQINIFIVGIPLKIGVGLMLLVICFPSLAIMFEGLMYQMRNDMYLLIKFLS